MTTAVLSCLLFLVRGAASFTAGFIRGPAAGGRGLIFGAAVFAARGRSLVTLHARLAVRPAAAGHFFVLARTTRGHIFPVSGFHAVTLAALLAVFGGRGHLVTACAAGFICLRRARLGRRRGLGCGLRPGRYGQGKDQSKYFVFHD